jgi:hypothetical protein
LRGEGFFRLVFFGPFLTKKDGAALLERRRSPLEHLKKQTTCENGLALAAMSVTKRQALRAKLSEHVEKVQERASFD